MSKLNKAQMAVLSAAAKRADHVLQRPQQLDERFAKALGTTLLKRGLVAVFQVKRKQPAWRTGEDGVRIGLALTAEGLRAVRSQSEPDGAEVDPARALAASDSSLQPERAHTDAPRRGTKQSLVLGLLRRPSGAGLDELVAATGWLPHTTRAALTGLRQRGFAIDRCKGEDGRSVYLIKNPEEALTSVAA